ncbi:FixH family protein [Desulfobulbus sp. TB]|nr:FixH family protein [Desulfobulbus sp. TB]
MKVIMRAVHLLFWTTILLLATVVSVQAEETNYEPLPGEGKKIEIGKDYSFTYKFNKKPQLGIAILKIQLSDKDGKRDTSLKITGDSGMPSMPHHDTGEKEFKLSNKGDYLLPVDVVMPGEWAVKVALYKDDKVIYQGIIKFDL